MGRVTSFHERKEVNTLPKTHFSDVLSEKQLEFLARQLPRPQADTGRPAYSNLELLPGILKVLRSGCRWRDLDFPGLPSGVTHWRRLRFWQEKASLWPTWKLLLSLMAKIKQVALRIVKLDGSLVPSYQFSSGVGYSGKHKRNGVKVSSVVDQEGLPLSVQLASGNIHDLALALPTINTIRVGKRTRPSLVLADKGYDSRVFRRALRKRGIKANIPERQYRKRRKRGRPPAYDSELGKTRFTVERTNGWMKSFRRIHFRFDRSLVMFEAWVLLACVVICLRRFLP